MRSRPSVGTAGAAVKLACLLLTACAAGATTLLELPSGRQLPPLLTTSFSPDLFAGGDCATMAIAADKLRGAVQSASGQGALPVRLDAFDLCNVGDCESCSPPPADPHRFIETVEPVSLSPSQFRFVQLAANALAGTRAEPYLVVPAGQMPPDGWHAPDNLLVLLASPPPAVALSDQGLSDRRRQLGVWQSAAAQVRPLVIDGFGMLAGLPRSGSLLEAQTAALGPSVAVAADAEGAGHRDQPGLAGRMRAVLSGATSPTADLWRTDAPQVARLADLYLGGPLVSGSEAVVAVLQASAAWDLERGPAQHSALLAALEAWQAHPAGPAEGPLGPAWQRYVERNEPLPSVDLPALRDLVIDGEQTANEWAGSLKLSLERDDAGERSRRPSTVRLALDGGWLCAAVVATEPDPSQVTLNDRLVLTLSEPDTAGPAVRITADLRGHINAERLDREGAQPKPFELTQGSCVGVFDGPGWSLEARVPLAALALDPHEHRLRLQVATEHLAGRERFTTVWLPTAGAGWSRRRHGWLRLPE